MTMSLIDQIWPTNVYPKAQKWDRQACGVNSEGTTPVYGPYPPMPRPELGDQAGEFHEVMFRTWFAQRFPFSVYDVYVRRRFMFIEPTPGTFSWEEVP
jgi:hypothetical protein